MSLRNYAKALGRRGGLKRAKRLSGTRRKAIAAAGGHARSESLRLAKRIEVNFRYIEAIREMTNAPTARSLKRASGKLPGIYE